MTLLEQMSHADSFSVLEQSIITYLMNHNEIISDLTIEELSTLTYSSNATIIRLTKKLGCSGFRQFKIEFAKELESLKYISTDVNYSSPFKENQNTQEIIQSMADLYKNSIDQCLQRLDSRVIAKIVEAMMASQRIFIFAYGDTQITAQSFKNKLLKLNIYPIIATENNEEAAMIYNMNKEDCALFLSYEGVIPKYKEYLNVLTSKQVTTIGICANRSSPLITQTHHHLLIAKKEGPFKIATFYSQLVFEFILNTFYSLIYQRDFQHHKTHKDTIDFLKIK